MPRWVWVWGPAIGQMALIFVLSSLSEAPLPDGMSDHAGHGIGYAMLSAFVLWGLSGGQLARVTAGRTALAVVWAVAYGLTDEFHQSFVPGRTPAWDDIGADARGALIGVALVLILRIINKLWPTRT